MANFSILDTVFAELDPPNLLDDFRTRASNWHKSLSHTRTRKRKTAVEHFAPDQQSQQVVQPKKEEKNEEPVEPVQIPVGQKPVDAISPQIVPSQDNKHFPRFTLLNERKPKLTLRKMPNRNAPSANASRQVSMMEPIRPQTMPRQITSFINAEEFFILNKINEQKRQQQLDAEQQKMLMSNKMMGGKRILPQIIGVQRTLAQTPHREVIRPLDYSNQIISQGKWEIFWDIDNCPNIPLILDRSDRYLQFTDKVANRSGEKRSMREWNTLDINENSNFYSPLFIQKHSQVDENVQHAEPAYNLTLVEYAIRDYEHFHHPVFDTESFLNTSLAVTFVPDKVTEAIEGISISPYLKELKSLSARSGPVFIIEHTTENPPFIINVGMGSLLTTYWHKENPLDSPLEMYENMQILEPDQSSPFIAPIPKNRPIQSFQNQLYRVPVHDHKVPSTDFLLIKDLDYPQFYLKKFDSIYCAGSIEPLKIVMTPMTKKTALFHKDFIKAILINIFKGTELSPHRDTIQIQQVQQEFFPDINETKLRKILKTFSTYSRANGNNIWKKNKDVSLEQLFAKLEITPEKVVSYQSMNYGIWRLQKAGINVIKSAPRLYQKMKKLKGEMTKLIASKIEQEFSKTPWAKTSSFQGAFDQSALEMINSDDGDQILRKKNRRSHQDQARIIKKPLARTKADLRSLPLSELRDKLLSLGVPKTKIDSTHRWGLVGLLRQLATRQKEDDPTSKIAEFYARGPRNDYQASIEQFKQQYKMKFENNLNFISASDTISNEEFDDGNALLEELGLSINHADDDEEEDEDDLFNFDETTDEEPRQRPKQYASPGDPAELVPYGICTYPTKIDWESIGLGGYPMRPVAKLITVSFSMDTGLDISVKWKRSKSQIEQLKRNHPRNVYQNISKASDVKVDLESQINERRKEEITKKIKRVKTIIAKKKNNTITKYTFTDKDGWLVNETKEGNLYFSISPSLYERIMVASAQYNIKAKRSKKKSSSSTSVQPPPPPTQAPDKDDKDETYGQRKKTIRRPAPGSSANEPFKKVLEIAFSKSQDFDYFRYSRFCEMLNDNSINNCSRQFTFEDIYAKFEKENYNTIKFYADIRTVFSYIETIFKYAHDHFKDQVSRYTPIKEELQTLIYSISKKML